MSDTKAITIRLEEGQAKKLEELGRQLRNSDAGVMRFALDVLHTAMTKASSEIDRAASEKVSA